MRVFTWGYVVVVTRVLFSAAYLDEIDSVRRHLIMEKRERDGANTPVLVHCSAGVGRSGVVVLADIMKTCLEHNMVSISWQTQHRRTLLERQKNPEHFWVFVHSQHEFSNRVENSCNVFSFEYNSQISIRHRLKREGISNLRPNGREIYRASSNSNCTAPQRSSNCLQFVPLTRVQFGR